MFANAELPIDGAFPRKISELRDWLLLNADGPIEATFPGRTRRCSPAPLKADAPMLTNESGSTTSVR